MDRFKKCMCRFDFWSHSNRLVLFVLCVFVVCFLFARRRKGWLLVCLAGTDVRGAAAGGAGGGETRHDEDLTGGQEAEGRLGVEPMTQGVADLEGGQGGFAIHQGVLDLVDH